MTVVGSFVNSHAANGRPDPQIEFRDTDRRRRRAGRHRGSPGLHSRLPGSCRRRPRRSRRPESRLLRSLTNETTGSSASAISATRAGRHLKPGSTCSLPSLRRPGSRPFTDSLDGGKVPPRAGRGNRKSGAPGSSRVRSHPAGNRQDPRRLHTPAARPVRAAGPGPVAAFREPPGFDAPDYEPSVQLDRLPSQNPRMSGDGGELRARRPQRRQANTPRRPAAASGESGHARPFLSESCAPASAAAGTRRRRRPGARTLPAAASRPVRVAAAVGRSLPAPGSSSADRTAAAMSHRTSCRSTSVSSESSPSPSPASRRRRRRSRREDDLVHDVARSAVSVRPTRTGPANGGERLPRFGLPSIVTFGGTRSIVNGTSTRPTLPAGPSALASMRVVAVRRERPRRLECHGRLGPGAGVLGGRIGATGTATEPRHCPEAGESTRIAGGVVSTTSMTVSSVEASPPVSAITSRIAWLPSGSRTSARIEDASPVPDSSQRQVAMSSVVPSHESGSLEAEPSSTASALPSPEHSTLRSSPARATGGWVTLQVSIQERP